MTTATTPRSRFNHATRLQPLRPIHMIDLSRLRLGAREPSSFVRTRAQLTQLFADRQQLGVPAFTVFSADAIVGLLLLERVSHVRPGTVFLSVWIDQDHRSRGLGTEAVRQALEAAEQCGLHRIETAVLPEDGAARRMLTRAGFTPVGLAREVFKVDGVWCDHVLFEYVVRREELVA